MQKKRLKKKSIQNFNLFIFALNSWKRFYLNIILHLITGKAAVDVEKSYNTATKLELSDTSRHLKVLNDTFK